MSEKEGLNLSPKSIGMVVAVVLVIAAGGGVGGVTLSRGVSTGATDEIRTLIEATIDERESTMTLDEAEAWRARIDRQHHVDETLIDHGKALDKLQTTVDGNTQTLNSIADKVGASE